VFRSGLIETESIPFIYFFISSYLFLLHKFGGTHFYRSTCADSTEILVCCGIILEVVPRKIGDDVMIVEWFSRYSQFKDFVMNTKI